MPSITITLSFSFAKAFALLSNAALPPEVSVSYLEPSIVKSLSVCETFEASLSKMLFTI